VELKVQSGEKGVGGEGAEGAAAMGQLILFRITHLGKRSLIARKDSRHGHEQWVKAKPTAPPFGHRDMSITAAFHN
jgi:hypothetical protein